MWPSNMYAIVEYSTHWILFLLWVSKDRSKQGCHGIYVFVTMQQTHLDANAPLCHISVGLA
jgi:hypothetical protein